MTTPGSPQAYLRTKVMTASPAELRLMLFDGAIKFAEQARRGMERGDYESVYAGVTRCQAILMELINGLRPEHDPELCSRLSGLYTFLYTRLMTASSQRDAGLIQEVLDLLQYERETWMMLLERVEEDAAAAAGPDATRSADGSDASSTGRTLSVQG